MKKFLAITIGILFSLSLIVALFLTSFDIVIYANMPDSFVNECVKYDVLDDVGISRADLADVTTEMFEYLRGNRESLADITTTINGQPDTPFFNEKECMHMADCKELFTKGYNLRRTCLFVAAGLLVILLLMFRENFSAVLHSLAVGMLTAVITFILLLGAAAALVVTSFNKYFTLFHEIFFDNDLWLLDPSKDRLLMIMPTGYFVDCVTKIGIVFGVMLIILLVLAIIRLVHEKHKHHEEGYPYYN